MKTNSFELRLSISNLFNFIQRNFHSIDVQIYKIKTGWKYVTSFPIFTLSSPTQLKNSIIARWLKNCPITIDWIIDEIAYTFFSVCQKIFQWKYRRLVAYSISWSIDFFSSVLRFMGAIKYKSNLLNFVICSNKSA